MVDMTVLGVSLQSEGGAPVLLLLHPHGTGKILSLAVGPMEAFAISTALQKLEDAAAGRLSASAGEGNAFGPAGHMDASGADAGGFSAAGTAFGAGPGEANRRVFPRPTTHDFMLRMLHSLGGRLLGVELTRMEDGVWFADAVIATGVSLVRLDCRPSDGIALALRCGALLRLSESLLERAEDIPAVLERLPEHVRTVALARIAAVNLAEGRPYDFSRVPLLVEAALASKKEAPGPLKTASGRTLRVLDDADDPAGEGGEPGKKGPAIHSDPLRVSIGTRRGEGGPAGGGDGKPGPSIRVALVRQDKKGGTEILEEFRLPAEGIPREVLESIGNPLDRLGDDVSEEERWAALLRVLAPETKVPM